MTKHVRPEPSEKPTREAMRHGDYVAPETRGSERVFTNRKVDMIAKLHQVGSITKKQAAAGLCFRQTYYAVWGTLSMRDSTVLRVGGVVHETEQQAEKMAHQRARLNTILNRIGARAYALLVAVAAFDQRLGKRRDAIELYELLTGALDHCAEVYGVNE